MSRAKRAHRTGRRGFTLVELMVGLSLGAIVLFSIYTIGAASTRHFQEQQRISQLQLATRIALDRVRRDVSLAGFGGAPNAAAVVGVGGGGGAPNFVAVALRDRDPAGMSALSALSGTAEANVESDSLVLTGNFDTGDVYLVRDYSGVTVNLQTNWQGFRRSFIGDAASTTIDTALFSSVFAPGRVVHITHPTSGEYFSIIAASSADTAGSTATITLSSALPSAVDVCLGCTIAPLSMIEYVILPATGTFVAPNPTVTGANTVLVRRELDFASRSPIPGTTRTILEWAIHFDADLYINTAPSGTPRITFFNDALAQLNGTTAPQSITSVALTIAARTPEMDERFPWVAPLPGAPLTRFRALAGRYGASRVRTARTEVFLPSVAY